MNTTLGPCKTPIFVLYGRVDGLVWDPSRLHWSGKDSLVLFMSFLAKLGRSLLQQRYFAPNLIEQMWQGLLPLYFRMCWSLIRTKGRTPKKAGILRLVWHWVIAVNMWWRQVNTAVDIRYPVCFRRSDECVLHKFWNAPLPVGPGNGAFTS